MTAGPTTATDRSATGGSPQDVGGRGADERRVVDQVPKQLFVDGSWVDAEGGATFEVLDPSTCEALCSVADASPADGRRAMEAAARAQAEFAATTPRQRADMLTRAFELLHERIDDLAL